MFGKGNRIIPQKPLPQLSLFVPPHFGTFRLRQGNCVRGESGAVRVVILSLGKQKQMTFVDIQ